MRTARKEHDPSNQAHSINSAYVKRSRTKRENPVRVYSYSGYPSGNVGEDGDFVLEDLSGLLIGPKANGKWPEEVVKVEGQVVGRHGWYPRWRNPVKPADASEGFLTRGFTFVIRFLLIGGWVKPHSAGSRSSFLRSLRRDRASVS